MASHRWLVVSNCQTTGFANCLSLLAPEVQIDAQDLHAFSRDFAVRRGELEGYDRLIVTPELRGKIDLPPHPGLHWVPGLYFCGYHPDLCYVEVGGQFLAGCMGDYQSNIVVESFRKGLSIDETVRLFRGEIYGQIGYFDLWAKERVRCIGDYAAEGMAIGDELLTWSRRGPFMHSVNHPTIEAIFGLSRVLIAQFFGEARDLSLRPHDNLAQGPVFPIYPEVAESLGVSGGSYLFKPPGSYRPMGLEEFIARSFALYESLEGAAMNSYSLYRFRIGDMIEART